MSEYTAIHNRNADAYKQITNVPTYMQALSISGKQGQDTHTMRKMYAKYILGNRIQPVTKGAVDARFAEAYEKAREEQGMEVEMGQLKGLTPRHTRVKG